MSARDVIARRWHAESDHADHTPFGLCNCRRVAGRMLPLLAEAWREGNFAPLAGDNPYETEEDRHVDQ